MTARGIAPPRRPCRERRPAKGRLETFTKEAGPDGVNPITEGGVTPRGNPIFNTGRIC